MLRELRIRDLGVIADAAVEFGPGLNVVTGETGAGKTMVVQSLGLLFGARADPGLVRSGAANAAVEGVIEGSADHPAFLRAGEAGADLEDELILVRTIGAQGRSRAVAGGRGVPAGLLAELAEELVVIHGQSDQWRLRSAEEQRALLDAFGGAAVAEAAAAYGGTYAAWRAAVAERERLTELSRSRVADLQALRFGVQRIEQVDPQPGEDLRLRAEDERLSNAEGLRVAAATAQEALVGDDVGVAPAVADLVSAARSALAGEAAHDPALAAFEARLGEVAALVSELAAELSAYAAGIDLDAERLAEVQQRRADLRSLARDFGGDVEATLAWLADASARLLEVDTAADALEEAERRERELRERLGSLAADLSSSRRRAADELGAAVTGELRHLAMAAAQIRIEVRSRPDPDGLLRPGDEVPVHCGADGCDDIEFVFRAAPDLPERPITRSASGGELSRVMLAVEVALGDRVAAVPTYVFDEVDAGVGGRAALDVGARLAQLARGAQVIVVTHLPQVAAFAARHLVVSKASDGQVTASGIRVVEDGDRDAELARMMAGNDSPTARSHAAELRERAARMSRRR